MKKAVVLFLFVFLILAFCFPTTFGQTPTEEIASPAATLTEDSDYKLPYPGILPNHPLYKLKVLRDKSLLFFTFDPFKKAARHLHMADKELVMALKLAEKGKVPLAQHTAFKAEHHMTLLVNEIKRAVYSGRKLDKQLVNQAHQAAKKHLELLEGMRGRANRQEKEAFEIIKEFSTRNDTELLKLEQELKEKP